MRRILLAFAMIVAPIFAAAQAATPPAMTMFAAASLTDALNDVGNAWQKQGHAPIRFSYGASSTMARQIEQGAPANLFASADAQWMDYLAKRNLLAPGTRKDLLSNRLVLIVPASHAGSRGHQAGLRSRRRCSDQAGGWRSAIPPMFRSASMPSRR